MSWIVVAHNSDQQVQAFGPFDTEEKAEAWARRQERTYPRLDWLALPIHPKSVASPWARVG